MHDLTIATNPAEGGTTNPSSGIHSFTEGSTVTVTALPALGYSFDHWEGNVAGTSSASTTVQMSNDQTVTAYFTTAPTYNLTLAIDPPGSGSTTPSSGIHSYNDGSEVTISAIPATGYVFDHWGGDVAEPYSATTTVIMDEHQNVTAYFAEAALGSVEPDGAVSALQLRLTALQSHSVIPRELAQTG